jgi:hypothetical protein
MADQRVLCEEPFPAHGYLSVSSKCGDSLSEYGIPGGRSQ